MIEKMKEMMMTNIDNKDRCIRGAGLSYTGSEIIYVHKTKEESEHNNT